MRFLNILAIMAILFAGYACDNDDETPVINDVKITLSYPDGVELKAGVSVKARATDGAIVYELKTDDTGAVSYQLPVGSYEFSSTETRASNGKLTAYNALMSKVITAEWDETSVITLEMEASTKSQLIIKEIYYGGCPTDDGTDTYSYGNYIVVYNNSMENVDLQNLCLGSMSTNSNSMSSEINDGDDDAYWFKEDWTPAAYGYFFFPHQTILEPGKELVLAISGGIDHTQTHSQSVDLSKSEYYVCYDIDVYTHALTYPAPSANIDPSHYLNAVKYGPGTAAVVSKSSPALFLFYADAPFAYGSDRTGDDYWKGNDMFPRKKVPAEWTVDAIEAFRAGYESKNKKRLNPKIDAGHIYLETGKGYTLYRNVDQEATEAIEGNSDKLVYNYSLGTVDVETKHGTTDPSGIDAEASMANGATIIFMDTNNSSNDFHLRQKSSLRN